MSTEAISCVVLADRHHGLTEGVRELLRTVFGAVVMVADETSLNESVGRLQPALVVADLSLAHSDSLKWLEQLHTNSPQLRLIVLSVHDEASACRAALEAGADGFVLKRTIATDLLPAVDAVQAGRQYVSPAVTIRPVPRGAN